MKEKIYIPADFDHDENRMQTICASYSCPDEEMQQDHIDTIILMIHSLPGGTKSGKNNFFSILEHQFTKSGYNTLRFDFRGCGESDGSEKNITMEEAKNDIDFVMGWIKSQKDKYSNLVIIGEGIGGALALELNSDINISSIILLWPFLDTKEICVESYNYSPEDPKDDVRTIKGVKVSNKFLSEMYQTDLRSKISSIEAPILIQLGANDEIVPVSQLDIIKENATSSERVDITTYQDGTHGLPDKKHQKAMLHHIKSFVNQYI